MLLPCRTSASCCAAPVMLAFMLTALPPSSAAGKQDQLLTTENFGGAIIAGGYNGFTDYSSVEVIDTDQLPDLQEGVSDNTLAAVGPVLYSCGGQHDTESLSTCYTIDVSSEHPSWKSSVDLPRWMTGHTAVTVGSRIWYAYKESIYEFNPENDTFLRSSGTYINHGYHCAVSNGTNSIMLGLGDNRDEVWISITAETPISWMRIGRMMSQRTTFGCLWLNEDEILITGGLLTFDSTELFSIAEGKSTDAGNLHFGRDSHQMFFLEGQPAVAGGTDYPAFYRSIETYNATDNSWSVSTRRLEAERCSFGLAQLA